jgi:hypothetical protein
LTAKIYKKYYDEKMETIIRLVDNYPTLKNLAISFGFLYSSKKIVNLLNTRYSRRYPRFSNLVLPLGYIYGLHMSSVYLKLASQFPTHSFWKFILDIYYQGYSISYSLSLITFFVGYPTINILANMTTNYIVMILDKFKRVIRSDHIDIKTILESFQKMKEALEKNKNWDIVLFNSISLKTFHKVKPILDDETLEKICPLRNIDNPSNSKYLNNGCAVCREDVEIKLLHRELPCEHVFHPQCSDIWLLERDATCPMCRKPIE